MGRSKIVLLSALTIFLISQANAGTFVYNEITSSGTSYQLDGNKVVWSGSDGSDTEIYTYDGTEIAQITNNSVADSTPDISGDNITWVSGWSINYYNGTSTSVLLNADSRYFSVPRISGSNVVWNDHTYYGGKWQLWRSQNGATPEMLVDYTSGGNHLNISGNNIVYRNRYSDIYLYTGSSNILIRANPITTDQIPVISGNNVAFVDSDGTDLEVFYYDGSGVTQITDNNYTDGYGWLSISDNKIVWAANSEIFLFDGTSVTQITDNAYADSNPSISGDYVVWHGFDGTDNEIFLYDGTSITQLTDNTENDTNPLIDGDTVVWGADGALYYGTYTPGASQAVPEPASLILLGIGIFALIRKRFGK